MQTVTVKRDELLTILLENRANHRALFEAAVDGYRKMVLAELERRIEDVRAGKSFDRIIRLEEPVDHTEDYDRVIRMAEMSVTDEIDLTQADFAAYVMDQWRWKQDFIATASSYGAMQ